MKLFMELMMKLMRLFLGKIILLLNRLTSPTPIQRTPVKQAEIDQKTSKLILYQFEACPFCVKVRRTMTRLNLKIELRDAQKVTQFKDELTQKGGMFQTPCLRIEKENGSFQWMYESSDIIQYLENQFQELSPAGTQ